MLCPNCGTEVGDNVSLCPRCAARQQQAESGGSAIGAIRPALKVVRLKPGEPPPPEFRAQQQAQLQASERLPPPREIPGSDLPPREFSGRPEPVFQQPVYDPPAKKLPYAAIGIMLAAVVAAVMVLIRGADPDELFPQKSEKAAPDLSHIVIHQKQDIVVDNVNVIGVFQVREDQLALNRVEATWSESKNALELNYFAKKKGAAGELPLGGSAGKVEKPAVKVIMQFSPSKGRIEKEKLQSYLIDYNNGDEALRVVKTYSVRLAAFGEVAGLAGNLKNGEKIHGKLEGSHTVERGGESIKVSWVLGFETNLKVIP